jgi:hypothetical protein
MDSDDGRESEERLVAFWRYERLTQMGFSHEQACTLNFWGVDLHDTEFLISRGCKHHIAIAILEPMR